MSSDMDIIYMTYRHSNANESTTGRRTIGVTPAMLKAGGRKLIFDDVSSDEEIVMRVLAAALEAGGFQVLEVIA